MDVELQGLADRNQKSKLQVKTRGYKGELTRQKNEVVSARYLCPLDGLRA
jgi:hypothetical protein